MWRAWKKRDYWESKRVQLMSKTKDDILDVQIYDSIEQVDKNLWDSIVSPNHLINSYEYLKAVEKSEVNNFTYRYLLFFKDGELAAHISTGILTFYIDNMTGSFIKNIAETIRKVFKGFFRITVIESGPSTGLGPSLVIHDRGLTRIILERLDRELKKIAKEQKTSIIAIRDFYIHQKKEVAHLQKLGYKTFNNLPNTFIKMVYTSFDDYLASFTSKRRREIKKRIDYFEKMGGTIEKITDFSGLAALLESLWQNTFNRATEYQREVLNTAYFEAMSDHLEEKSYILLAKVKDKPVGFTMFLDSGDTLISTYCGLDYDYTRDYYTYFMLFYESIKNAIDMKKNWIELGVTNYNPKMEAGALPEPLSVYVKSLNPIVNSFFARLMSSVIQPPDFNKRNIFNKRKYERFTIRERIPATVGHTKCQVQEISRCGLQIVSTEAFKVNKRLHVHIEIPGDFTLHMPVQVKNCRPEEGGIYIIGMQITKKKPAPQWELLIERQESVDC